MSSTLTIITRSPEDTRRLGHVIGEQAQPGDIYLLTGPLGAGKTCLTQGIGQGLAVAGHPRSPTFVLMNRYRGRLTLHHMDLYRIGSPLEAWDLGLDEYLEGDGVCVIEWADQAEEFFPEDSLWIGLDYAGEGDSITELEGYPQDSDDDSEAEPEEYPGLRSITLGPASGRYAPLLRELARIFRDEEVSP